MRELQGIDPLQERLQTSLELPEPEPEVSNDEESLFFQLFKPSQGEMLSNWIICMRDEYSQPKPSQALVELVESIVDRYTAGEWRTADAEPAEGAISLTGTPETATGLEPTSIAFIEKKPEGSGKQAQSIEELYHKGTLLYAMYPPPEENEYTDHLERYHNEGFIMAQAIDAFLEYAPTAEREALIALIPREERVRQ